MVSVFFLIFGSIGETPFAIGKPPTPEFYNEVRDISRQVVAALFVADYRSIKDIVVYAMGRGRKGLLNQSVTKHKKIMYEDGYFLIKHVDTISKPVDPIDLPYEFIEKLKQMDRKAVADILLK